MSFIEGDEKKINRRDFTREAGLGGVAMAGVGAGPFLEANNPKSMSETLPKEWDLEAEVVVIGSGATGLPAAIRAADQGCLLYTSPSPRDRTRSRMPSSA